MPRGHVRLSPTAYFTAGAWVHEGFENAELFDTWLGRLLFEPAHFVLGRLGRRLPSMPWHEEFLLIRHYVIDRYLEQASPTFVLEAGAGLSPRGLTFAHANPEATYVEVDLPHIVHRKRRYLKGRGAPSNYHLVDGDITDPHVLDGLPRLPSTVDDVLVITEGVLDYLTMRDKGRALGTFSRLLRGVSKGTHVFDAYTKQRLESYRLSAGAVLVAMSVLGGRRFKDQLFENGEAAIRFAKSSGYSSARLLDVAALNPSRYHPPMTHCHFELIEARAQAANLPSMT